MAHHVYQKAQDLEGFNERESSVAAIGADDIALASQGRSLKGTSGCM